MGVHCLLKLTGVGILVDAVVYEAKLFTLKAIFELGAEFLSMAVDQAIFAQLLAALSQLNASFVLAELGKHQHSVVVEFRAKHLAKQCYCILNLLVKARLWA